MKNIYFAAIIVATLAACNTAPTDKKAESTAQAGDKALPPPPPPPPPAAAVPAKGIDSLVKSGATTAVATTVDGTKCYILTEGKDVTAVQITTTGDKVTGYMDWSPFEKDGGHGFLVGTKTGNSIKADYVYMIEGSKNTEEVVFKIEGNKLMKAQGELTEKKGRLVIKDMAKVTYKNTLTETPCDKVAKNIGFAKSAEKALKKM